MLLLLVETRLVWTVLGVKEGEKSGRYHVGRVSVDGRELGRLVEKAF